MLNNISSYPKILVVSNNSFSTTQNNGKTLFSFFENYPKANVSQLYFYDNYPDVGSVRNYYRITDKNIIKNYLKIESTCGGIISPQQQITNDGKRNKFSIVKPSLYKNDFFRILREKIWDTNIWKTEELDNWIDEIKPDIIFFCAGDFGAAYDIVEYVQTRYSSKLLVYITDDYVLPRTKENLFQKLRRNMILDKMNKAINRSLKLFTISEEMSQQYEILFNKESEVMLNTVESLKEEIPRHKNDTIKLVYAGGFHFKRYLVLNEIAKSIQKYNSENKSAFLEIYSNESPDQKMLKLLNIDSASQFMGSLDSLELKKVLNKCDIPVHVESFDEKMIECTRLSISTKIPEYLSLGKPILAVGPQKISSIKYLNNSAFCINDLRDINEKLSMFLDNRNLQKDLSLKASELFEKKHSKKINSKKFIDNLLLINK